MLSQISRALLLLPIALRAGSALVTVCNNSPALCSRTYDNVTHLGAHDSPFVRDSSTHFSSSGNQYYNSTVQLAAGVRLLTAQVQTTNSTSTGQLHVCHTSCDLLDAGKLSGWLGEINTWLVANPNEVVTVLLVNGAGATASDLAAEYQEAGISDIVFKPNSTSATSVVSTTSSYAVSTPSTSSTSSAWPTLQSLISAGTRMVNFVDTLPDDSESLYLFLEFDHIFENSYENTSPSDFSCVPNRPSSVANDTDQTLSQGLMPFMNHFLYEQQAFGIQLPNDTYITTTNARSGGVGNLGSAASACSSVYGKAPTFVLVDFVNVGPAMDTVDRLNGITSPIGRTEVSSSILSATSGAVRANCQFAMLCLTLLAALVAFVEL
ncbi:hypothetical protein LTR08_002319 [Meristemomyces frigidus]|nr:hypothetical protein LTR08_002319 [Meristemomyces frigidus]